MLDTLKSTGETARTVEEALSPIESLLGLAGDYWWVLALGGGAAIAFFAAKAAWARLDDHRNARTV